MPSAALSRAMGLAWWQCVPQLSCWREKLDQVLEQVVEQLSQGVEP